MTGIGPVLERLDLWTFADENGRTLYDVPDGSISDPDAPVPPRFLSEFDNVLLWHDDRTRVVPEEFRKRALTERFGKGTVLVDGFVAGEWGLERGDDGSELAVEPYGSMAASDRGELIEEGRRLLAFLTDGDGGTVTVGESAP